MEVKDRMRAIYTRYYEAKTEKGGFTQEKKNKTISWRWVSVIPLVGVVVGLSYIHKRKKSSPSIKVNYSALPICWLVKTNARKPDFKLNDVQWEELRREMDFAFDGFTDRLLELCPKLSEVEIHVCYLVKLEVPPTDIAHIIVRQKNTVSTIRERLNKKLYGKEGTAKQFDKFIEQF